MLHFVIGFFNFKCKVIPASYLLMLFISLAVQCDLLLFLVSKISTVNELASATIEVVLVQLFVLMQEGVTFIIDLFTVGKHIK